MTASSLLAGRYRVGHLLGRGGMADVHSALDESTGALVAVKVFRDPLLGGLEGEVRFGEVNALAGLRHPGLVELLDVGEDQGRPFCVMTLVDGPTLAERLERGPMPLEAVARVGSDLAATLAYVHGRGILHRDVKPANVILAGDGRARLVDFGIAQLVDATRVTRSGFAVGTAAYLAPEQVNGERISPAVDLYALGLVLLECLTGRREYDGPVLEAALARLHRRPRIPAELPAGWTLLLEALTADDPVQRPAAEIVASAAGVLAEQSDAPRELLRLAGVAEVSDERGTTSDHDLAPEAPRPPVVAPNPPASPPADVDDRTDDAPTEPVRTRTPRPELFNAESRVPSPRRRRRGLVLSSVAGVLVLGGSAAVFAGQRDSAPGLREADSGPPPSAAPAAPSSQAPPTVTKAPAEVTYSDCEAVRVAGKVPLRRGEPGYSRALDTNGDGIACETSTAPPRPPAAPTPAPVFYANCEAVSAADKVPLLRGQPGYSRALDTNGDGFACETS
ncbi:MAG: protein kinase [Frankiales bacterium]|nr:protein kinase [Frankiales bacterium]